MSDDDLSRFEARLRQFRPAGPPARLRERVVAPRPGPSWRSVAVRLAAVFFLAVAVPTNMVIEGLSGGAGEPLPELPRKVVQVTHIWPGVDYPRFSGFQSRHTARLDLERRCTQWKEVTEL